MSRPRDDPWSEEENWGFFQIPFSLSPPNPVKVTAKALHIMVVDVIEDIWNWSNCVNISPFIRLTKRARPDHPKWVESFLPAHPRVRHFSCCNQWVGKSKTSYTPRQLTAGPLARKPYQKGNKTDLPNPKFQVLSASGMVCSIRPFNTESVILETSRA